MRDFLRASAISFQSTFTWRKVGAVVMTSDSGERESAHSATAAALYVFPEAWQDFTAVRGFLAAEVRISCWTRHGFWPSSSRANVTGSCLASRTTDRSADRLISLILGIIGSDLVPPCSPSGDRQW